MIYFLLSIASSTAIYLIFKLFSRFGIQTFQAIVINYWVAFSFGLLLIPSGGFENFGSQSWIWLVPIEGILFITIFNVMALTVQKHSVTVGSVASRTAMIIPAGILMFLDPSEGFSLLKVAGIILACLSVYLSSKKSGHIEIDKKYIYLPLILFIGSGLIDLIIGYAQSHLMSGSDDHALFIPGIFMVAGSIGTSILIYRYVVKKDIVWQVKDLVGGLILGVINYMSIYFILKAMDTGLLHESIFFPVNSMGIIAAGTLLGLLAFKEKLSVINWVGIALGISSIGLLILAS